MSLPYDNIVSKVVSLTENYHFSIKQNIYRETLRQLLSIFGNIYYLGGSGDRVKVKCSTGKPDRPTGKDENENNLVLPYITITEIGSEESDERRRVNSLLVNEKIWDEKENRAKRYLSLAPRAINISYQINIWAKYNSDLDQIRYAIFTLFNPSLDIRTKFSDYTKAFVKSEADINSQEAGDTTDRLVQKTITISVETYLPSPKFLFTNTGEIKSLNAEVILKDTRQDATEQVTDIGLGGDIIENDGGSGGGGGGGIIGPLTLSGSLDDVNIVTVDVGQVLAWDGTSWVASSIPIGGPGGSDNHQDLTLASRLNSAAHPQYASSSVSAYAFGLSSTLGSHIGSASVHFTSGSLSGAYVLTSTNSNLSSLVSNIQASTISLSSYISANESSWSSAGATYLSSLLDVDFNSFPAANKYSVIYNSSTDLFEVRQLQFNDLSDYVFTGLLSDNWVLAYTSIVPAGFTARPLSDLVQLDTLNDVDVPSPALNDILQYTDDGSSYQWRNLPASSLVSSIEASTITISSTLESHLASAVHWELSTLNTNYLNASGDSANAGFYLSSVSATDISATNYYNLPSATIVWEQAQDIVLLVKSNVTIPKGTPVTIVSGTGSNSDIPLVQILSSVNNHIPEAYGLSNHVAGLAKEEIQAGETGYIIVEGLLKGYDTLTPGWNSGDFLYVSSNGQLSNQRPPAPYESHPVGIVIRTQQNNGSILVKIENSPELNDIVGFNLSQTILDGDLITYDLTTSTFVNKQTVNVSGLGKFGTVSATTVSAGTLHVGGSDGIIRNNNGDIIISATNGIIRFPFGLSAASVSTTTYNGLPSSTALWNANQLQGRPVLDQTPNAGQVLTWNNTLTRWEPSTVSTGNGGVTNNPGGSTQNLQYNSGGGFGGASSVNYIVASDRLEIKNLSALNVTAVNLTNDKLDNHIASADIHFTSGSLSGYYAGSAWTDSRYVLTSTNSNLSSLVNNIQTSSNNLSGVVGAHIGSAVHWNLETLNTNYLNSSGDSANASFYLSGLSATNFSATTYLNLPSGAAVWNASSLLGYRLDNTILPAEGSLLAYTNYGTTALPLAWRPYDIAALGTLPVYNAIQLQGRNVSSTTPNTSALLVYNGTAWTPSYSIYISGNAPSNNVGNNGDLYFQYGDDLVVSAYILSATNYLNLPTSSLSGLLDTSVTVGNIGTGKSLVWNGSKWIPSSVGGGVGGATPFGGYSNPPHEFQFYNAGGLSSTSGFIYHPTLFNGRLVVSSPLAGLNVYGSIYGDYVEGSVFRLYGQGTSQDIIISPASSLSASKFEIQSLSATTASATTYLNLPSGTATWNANKLQGYNISSNAPTTNQGLVYDGNGWIPSSLPAGGAGATPFGSNYQFQFYNNGALSSVSGFTWDPNLFGGRLVVSSPIAGLNVYGNIYGNAVESGDKFTLYGQGTSQDIIMSPASSLSASKFQIQNLSATTISATTYQNLPVSSLSGLADVQITGTPTINYVLKWNGTKWAPAVDATGTGGGIANAYATISDGNNSVNAAGEDTLTLTSLNSILSINLESDGQGGFLNNLQFTVNQDQIGHGNLNAASLTTGDPHTQYALKSLSSTAYWNANKLQGYNISSTAPTPNQALVYDGNGWTPSSLPAGGSTTPGGSNGNVQFNNNGVFSGVNAFNWNAAKNDVEVETLSATNISATNLIANNMWQIVVASANQTVTSTTMVSSTGGLEFNMLANTRYILRSTIFFSGSTATADIKYGFSGPAAPTYFQMQRHAQGPGAVAFVITVPASGYDNTGTTVTTTATGFGVIYLNGIIVNGANAGKFFLVFGSGGAGNNTIQQGSYIEYLIR